MFLKTRLYFTLIITFAIWALLAWEHFHGGVPSHHILAREDLPEISNWWGAILLPFLALFLSFRTEKRITKKHSSQTPVTKIPSSVPFGFFGAMFYGITLASFFAFGNTEMPGYMLIGTFVISFIFPIYRAECILGFVIGMAYTFGAVLPTGIGSILALIGAFIYLVIRPLLLFVALKLKNLGTTIANKP